MQSFTTKLNQIYDKKVERDQAEKEQTIQFQLDKELNNLTSFLRKYDDKLIEVGIFKNENKTEFNTRVFFETKNFLWDLHRWITLDEDFYKIKIYPEKKKAMQHIKKSWIKRRFSKINYINIRHLIVQRTTPNSRCSFLKIKFSNSSETKTFVLLKTAKKEFFSQIDSLISNKTT